MNNLKCFRFGGSIGPRNNCLLSASPLAARDIYDVLEFAPDWEAFRLVMDVRCSPVNSGGSNNFGSRPPFEEGGGLGDGGLGNHGAVCKSDHMRGINQCSFAKFVDSSLVCPT